MVQIHLGGTPNVLTTQQLKELGEKTELYSGSDISVVVRDAMMQPVRAVQSATHFKKVSGPSPTDPNVEVNDLLTPCSPGDSEAIELSWTDVDGTKLKEPVITYNDFLKSLRTTRPTVNQKDLTKYAEWTSEYGQEG